MNMCLIGGAPRPGEFVVNHREQWGGSLGGGSLMPSLASTTRLSGCGRALQEPTSPNQSPPQSLRE